MSREEKSQGVSNGSAGRRPFIINPQNRNMLHMIRDTLGSKIPKNDDTDSDGNSLTTSSNSSSTASAYSGYLSSGLPSTAKSNRGAYNKEAIKSIAKFLKPFQTNSDQNGTNSKTFEGNSENEDIKLAEIKKAKEQNELEGRKPSEFMSNADIVNKIANNGYIITKHGHENRNAQKMLNDLQSVSVSNAVHVNGVLSDSTSDRSDSPSVPSRTLPSEPSPAPTPPVVNGDCAPPLPPRAPIKTSLGVPSSLPGGQVLIDPTHIQSQLQIHPYNQDPSLNRQQLGQYGPGPQAFLNQGQNLGVPPQAIGGSNKVTIRYVEKPPPPYGQAPAPRGASVKYSNGEPGQMASTVRRPSGTQITFTGPSDGSVLINLPKTQSKMPVQNSYQYHLKQEQIHTDLVNSQRVQRIKPQTATGPMSGNNQPGSSYVSQLETIVNPAKVSPAYSNPAADLQIRVNRGFTNNYYKESMARLGHTQNPRPQIQIHFPNPNHHGPYIAQGVKGADFLSNTPGSTPRSESPVPPRTTNQSPMSTTSTPSSTSDYHDKPPPPYPGLPTGRPGVSPNVQVVTPYSKQHGFISTGVPTLMQAQHQAETPPSLPPREPIHRTSQTPPPLPNKISNTVLSQTPPGSSNKFQKSHKNCANKHTDETEETDTETLSTTSDMSVNSSVQEKKTRCTSPIPERTTDAKEKDSFRNDTFVKNYSPQAFKFYMEQHVENLIKDHKQREKRRIQLEKEMMKENLPEDDRNKMRKILLVKESNYIRLKRAKMHRTMFEKIKTLGVGAFGEVALVRKKDLGYFYAMKTLRKSDVLKRNQVAHVKAERDILAEADNEWVVKLYYSFQDRDNLYFVMDYVQGGDLMGLLIKLEIFEEPLAQFYIAELVLAIESVHKMKFIHRDIKPDNILIDKDGHIKLTDFGLCTGFRWTHNSKYYQPQGQSSHMHQDSMDFTFANEVECKCGNNVPLKPLERRKKQHAHRCLAHSLVGTPNYIAPEVLKGTGYTSCCDWWSVGVILYEMIVGQPPFYAETPQETQLKVINWKEYLRIPKELNLSPQAIDLIQRLCCDQENRLGANGAQEIKEHAFFASLNFEGLRKRKALYKPKISHPMDTSNFDPIEPDRIRESNPEEEIKKPDHPSNGKHPQHAFYEFTYRRFFDDMGHPYPQMQNFNDEDSDSVADSEQESIVAPVFV